MNEQNNALKRNGTSTSSRTSSSSTNTQRQQQQQQQQHNPPYAIRIDSLEEDTSTAPITESNSHEDLIVRDPDEDEELAEDGEGGRGSSRHSRLFTSATQQFPRKSNQSAVTPTAWLVLFI